LIAAQPAADRQYFRLRRAVFMPFFAYFPPQTSNLNAQKAFNFGAKQKGRARRKEELPGFHLRLSMYLSAQHKGILKRLEGRTTFGSRTVSTVYVQLVTVLVRQNCSKNHQESRATKLTTSEINAAAGVQLWVGAH
jgi:hypothetical protein